MSTLSAGRPEALVTGASSGSGAATCRRLREQGWHVVGMARRPSREASVSLELDITSFGRLAAALRAVPYLSLLVDSAATILPVGSLLDSDPVEWR
jgi:NAD(P)-dependent dehydrogenase (short-subunit alcohol dehydrogenase family)